MSNNRKKVSISADLIPQIYELSAVKCLNDESTIVLVLDIFKEITSKIDVCMKAFHARLSIMNETMAFSFIKDDKEWNLEIPILNVDTEELKQFLLGKICFLDFLCLAAFNMSVDINTIPTAEQFMDVFETWDKYSNQIGYVEDKYTINIPDQEIKETLKEEGVVWYYGMSCSGKTYMGIKELNSYPIIKVAYNPCFSSDEEYALIKLLMYCGRNIAILLDDLQCDTEKTEELFKIIAEKKDTLKNRNIHIFMVSWVSLLTNEKVAGYQSVFKAFQVNTDRYIAQLQREIGDKKLRKICGKNLALLNSAAKYCEKNLGEPEKELFETFVKTNDAQKIESIYRLCVLGSFEYLVPKDFVEASVLSKELTTIKAVGTTYYVGHKEICRFLYLYIEKNKNALKINSLPAIDKIILDYIQEQEPGKQWRAIRQLIGEHGEEKLQSISLIWSGLSCFETAIKNQTRVDPAWGNAPSSMYFVLKVASLLGVLPDYKNVLDKFCEKFEVSEEEVKVHYHEIATTNDFNQIKKRMIKEDKTDCSGFEKGAEFDCNCAHKNWLLGLIVGLKSELCQYQHEDLYNAAVSELFSRQTSQGGWYPTRIPWITARILIGLSQAGYTVANDNVSRGISFLLEYIKASNHWEAHTGGWNTPYETSSLCLEAIYSSKAKLNGQRKERVSKVVRYLYDRKAEWMQDDKIVDGSATACCLLKNDDGSYGNSAELTDYIQKLCKDKVYSKIEKNKELNLQEEQSCQITQVAWYTMDFCWDVLYTQLPKLLNEFVKRSLQEKNSESEEAMKDYKIFISYSEDSKNTVNRIKKVSAYLRQKGYTVWCYADEPLGVNVVTFMQKAPEADVILVMGSKNYKEKSLLIDEKGSGSGVFFENLVLSQMFIYNKMKKIVPIAFEQGTSFEDSFPPPFSTNKGLCGYRVTTKFLENLAKQINNTLMKLEANK